MPKLAREMSLETILHGDLHNGLHATGQSQGLFVSVSSDKRRYVVRKHVGDEEYTCVLCGTVQEVSIDDAISCAELISVAFANGDLSKLNELNDLKLPIAIESYSSSKRVTHCGKDKTLHEIALDVLNNPLLNQSAAQDQVKRVLDRKSLINKFLCPLDGNVIGQNKSLLDPSTPIKDIGPDQFADQYLHSTSDQCHSRDYKFRSLIIEMLERALALGCYSSEDVQRFKLLTEHMSRQSYNHLPGLDYQLVPSFVGDLYHYGNGDGIFERQNNSAKLNENAIAYIFSILTAARSQAVRLMQWQEIDFARGIWTIPIAHDKIKAPNRIRSIVLASGALALLELVKSEHGDCSPESYVFIPPRKGDTLNDAGFKSCVKQINAKRIAQGLEPYVDPNSLDKNNKARIISQHATARASFDTWAAEHEGQNMSFRQSVFELCLLHQNEDNCPYGRAYNRNELIDDRRVVMEAWNDFCLSECSELRAMAAKFKR